MPTTPNTQVTGYTGINTIGCCNIQTEVLTAVTLASGDVTLTETQAACGRIEVTTGHASNAIIVPATAGKLYIVKNNHATLAALIKVAGGTAVSIAQTKVAIVQVNGAATQVERLTADA